MTTLGTRALLASKIRTGRKVLAFYIVTFVAVELIRLVANQ
ncbi:hypothetical protein [Bdellovibrio sp. ZAP7]|nr:hypothetical protein [Bdellovibrio sp. ZAP7]